MMSGIDFINVILVASAISAVMQLIIAFLGDRIYLRELLCCFSGAIFISIVILILLYKDYLLGELGGEVFLRFFMAS